MKVRVTYPQDREQWQRECDLLRRPWLPDIRQLLRDNAIQDMLDEPDPRIAPVPLEFPAILDLTVFPSQTAPAVSGPAVLRLFDGTQWGPMISPLPPPLRGIS